MKTYQYTHNLPNIAVLRKEKFLKIFPRYVDCPLVCYLLLNDYFLFVPALGLSVKISKGFVFNGPSIPRFMRAFILPQLLLIASIMHDLGYIFKGKKWLTFPYSANVSLNKDLTRKELDLIFYSMILKSGLKKWRCKAIYYVIQTFGIFLWKENFDPGNVVFVDVQKFYDSEKPEKWN